MLDLTGGDAGTGVGLNDQGEFVISGWRGTVAGQIEDNGEVHFAAVTHGQQRGFVATR
ncbi:MAG: hypothetical protein AB7S38_23740 [Vulcanimicrobiota bacterium]